MTLTDYLKDASRAASLALALDTSTTYLKYHLAAGRKNISLDYALRIEQATHGAVRCESLRPDFPWKDFRTRCPGCDE